MPVARRIFRSCLLAAALGVGSCDRDPSTKLDDAEKSLRSWSATLRLADQQWTLRQVPATYLRQTLTAADKSLSQIEEELRQAPKGPRRGRLELDLGVLRERCGKLWDAAKRDDRSLAGTALNDWPLDFSAGGSR